MPLKGIPPITSTSRNPRNKSARLAGLATMSLGRYMSEKKTQSEKSDWSGAKGVRQNKIPNKTVIIKPGEKIICDITVFEADTLSITLQFDNVELLSNTFVKVGNMYTVPVKYDNKTFNLVLLTIGDIFECEIIGDVGKVYMNEKHVPSLLNSYDPETMTVNLESNFIIITYQRMIK